MGAALALLNLLIPVATNITLAIIKNHDGTVSYQVSYTQTEAALDADLKQANDALAALAAKQAQATPQVPQG